VQWNGMEKGMVFGRFNKRGCLLVLERRKEIMVIKITNPI